MFGFKIKDFPNVVEFDKINDPTYLTQTVLSRRQQPCALLLQQFWEHWSTEYLTALRERTLQSNSIMPVLG